MKETKIIGEKIAEIRKQKGITQRELAQRLGMKQQSISRIENGENSTGIDLLTKIDNILEAKIEMVERL